MFNKITKEWPAYLWPSKNARIEELIYKFIYHGSWGHCFISGSTYGWSQVHNVTGRWYTSKPQPHSISSAPYSSLSDILPRRGIFSFQLHLLLWSWICWSMASSATWVSMARWQRFHVIGSVSWCSKKHLQRNKMQRKTQKKCTNIIISISSMHMYIYTLHFLDFSIPC